MGRRRYWAQVMLLSLALLPVALWVYFHLETAIGLTVIGTLAYYGVKALHGTLKEEWAENSPRGFWRVSDQRELPNPVQRSQEELRFEARFEEIVNSEDWDKPGR